MTKVIYGFLATVASLILIAHPAVAQDDGEEDDSSGTNQGWQPSSGSLFGNAVQQQGGEGSVLGGPVQQPTADSDAEADGPELITFGLTFHEDVNFRDGYVEQFREAYREELDESDYNVLSRRQIRQRMRDAAVLAGGRPDAEQAQQIADRIEAENWLHAIIGASDRRNYEIVVTRGAVGQEEGDWTVCRETCGRRITAVETNLRQALRACLIGGQEGEE